MGRERTGAVKEKGHVVGDGRNQWEDGRSRHGWTRVEGLRGGWRAGGRWLGAGVATLPSGGGEGR